MQLNTPSLAYLPTRVWLTYWQDGSFGLSWSVYEGVYAALGVSSAVFTFAMGATMGFMAYFASNNLHREALENVFYSPMSVFETQPLGRILGVFGKDVDTIDNQLADSWRMLSMTLVSVSQSYEGLSLTPSLSARSPSLRSSFITF
jgi:ABC-type multidrug transport system fused ATPase/permease subunit